MRIEDFFLFKMTAKFQNGDCKHEIIVFFITALVHLILGIEKIIIACCSGCKIPYSNVLIILQYNIYVSTE